MQLAERIPTVPAAPRVLYVDDHHDVADTAVLFLRLSGFDAQAAHDGPAALAVASGFQPDVCFLDLLMPGMAGDELAVRLREQAGDRPLVLAAVTAVAGEETSARLRVAGFHHHLVKPVDPEGLLAVLKGGRGST